MSIYYFKFKIEGVATPQFAAARAHIMSEARKLIEARYGKVDGWYHWALKSEKDVQKSGPPSWYKGSPPLTN